MTPQRSDHHVLIIASDPLLAALVGALVETTDFRAAFPSSDERPEDALARVRPLAAVLVDAMLDSATSDVFLQRARKRLTPVLLFGNAERIARLTAWIDESAVRAFVLPRDIDRLREALLEFPLRPRRTNDGPRERRARTEVASDGHLVLVDRSGLRWSVYDRRSAGRAGAVHRSFVCETGERRGCDLAPNEVESSSASVLETQLAQAAPENP